MQYLTAIPPIILSDLECGKKPTEFMRKSHGSD